MNDPKFISPEFFNFLFLMQEAVDMMKIFLNHTNLSIYLWAHFLLFSLWLHLMLGNNNESDESQNTIFHKNYQNKVSIKLKCKWLLPDLFVTISSISLDCIKTK